MSAIYARVWGMGYWTAVLGTARLAASYVPGTLLVARPATIAAVVAVIGYDFFFRPPRDRLVPVTPVTP